jgi:hypothetical protein
MLKTNSLDEADEKGTTSEGRMLDWSITPQTPITTFCYKTANPYYASLRFLCIHRCSYHEVWCVHS